MKTIEVKNLVKKYKNLNAVDGISFDVYKNEVFGLLGENGAGKTTTLEIIEGLRKPTSGKIKISGYNYGTHKNQIKEMIGVQLQSSAYYNFLKLEEILDLFGSFYSKSLNSMDLLKMVHLEEKSNSRINQLSGGQKQRFSIIASLVNDPEIVFLDEPTTGLDPLARRNLWDLINKIRIQGKTIILTTHYMEEAEYLCDRIAIMEKGKILAMDKTEKLIDLVDVSYRIQFVDSGLTENKRQKIEECGCGMVEEINSKKKQYEIKLDNKADLQKVLHLVEKNNPQYFTLHRASLEDLFIQLTGKKIEVEEEENV